MRLFRKHLCILLVSTGSLSLTAQEDPSLEPLITDRPDATESPTAVPKGFLQVETGSFYESFKYRNIQSETYTFNTTLLRYGLLNDLELRLGWDFVEGSTKVNGNKLDNVSSGFNPLLLGFKTSIVQEKGWRLEIGFIGHLYLPFTASTDYKPETTVADFRFAVAHTLSENSSISYNLGAAWTNDSSEASYIYTLAYGYEITDKLGAFAEVYGDLPEKSEPTIIGMLASPI